MICLLNSFTILVPLACLEVNIVKVISKLPEENDDPRLNFPWDYDKILQDSIRRGKFAAIATTLGVIFHLDSDTFLFFFLQWSHLLVFLKKFICIIVFKEFYCVQNILIIERIIIKNIKKSVLSYNFTDICVPLLTFF